MPNAFPTEFRQDVVAVARKGGASIAQVAKDFGVSGSCLQRWLRLDDIQAGKRPGVSSYESAELRELRQRNRLLYPLVRELAAATDLNRPGLAGTVQAGCLCQVCDA